MARRSLALLLLLSASIARADTHAQASGSAEVGYTDNVLSAPTGLLGVPGPQADFFATEEPRLELFFENPRTIHRFAYLFSATQYASHDEANSLTSRLEWDVTHQISQRASIVSGMAVTEGHQASLNPVGPVGIMPVGGVSFVEGTAREALSYDLDPLWRLEQLFSAVAFDPLDENPIQPPSLSADLGFGLQRSWLRDAGSLELHGSYFFYDSFTGPDGSVAVQRNEVLFTGTLSWMHELSRWWSMELGGGVGFGETTDGQDQIWTPLGHASLRYVKDLTAFDLTVSQNAQANPLVGQTYLLDDAVIHAATVFGQEERYAMRGAVGFSHGETLGLDQTATPESSAVVNIGYAEAAVSWRPFHGVELELKHQLTYQHSSQSSIEVPTYSRNVTTLSVTLSYPNGRLPTLITKSSLQTRASEQDAARAGTPAAPLP